MKIKGLLFLLMTSFFLSEQTFSSSWDIISEPELTWIIRFIEEWWWYINISEWIDWVSSELFANEYINKNIEVVLICTSWNHVCNWSSTGILIGQNSTWSLTIEDIYWKKLTKEFKVWKIDKTPPDWELDYFPSNDTWTNWEKTVTLSWKDNESWLVWNDSPSYTCNIEWWCSWFLSLEDSAWNIFKKNYNIERIDKTLPTITIKHYAEIKNWKQNIGITCNGDEWWSGCKKESETIKWIQTWIETNQCVYDNAWNIKCVKFETAKSEANYSDAALGLDWTKNNRIIWLSCSDVLSGCKKNYKEEEKEENGIFQLMVEDKAWNKIKKEFDLSEIDKIPPNLLINEWPKFFKASDFKKINISFSDDLSWIDKVVYKWGSTCKNWNIINWIPVSNNESINYTVLWKHILYVCAKDEAWNIKEINQNFTIYPWDLDRNKTEISVIQTWDKYANNSDFYYYTLILKDKYWNYIYNKEVNIELDSSNFINTNVVDNNWDNAISLFGNDINSNNAWEINFKLKSLTPWSFIQKFKVAMNNWWDDYKNNSSVSEITQAIWIKSFLKPIVWELSVVEWWDIPEIWRDQKYKIKLTKVWNIENYSNWKINLSTGTLINKIDWHFWKTFWNIDNSFWGNIDEYLWFYWSIDVNDNILSKVEISSDNLVISYELWWRNIKYYLDDFWVTWCGSETLWLKIIWTLQWDGKSDITWQEKNISDLSKWKLRSKIRKNAYSLIRNRANNTVVNWIKYIEWNIEISWDLLYETLIVKNWNIIIDWDLNVSWKKLWIIVLKDNYQIESDYDKIWNIYVNNNVEKINAIIYADWVLRSTDKNWNSYSDSDLNTKLELNWGLFTRNTIGWAVRANSEYLLPWWQKTDNFDLAEIYDLNYIRKVNNSCWIWDNYSFLIKYDSRIQVDPPKWFGN